ncbi:MAG: proprotein convertase P-domain-containing protein [Chloroherpetonaceae bacterium]|nr:proprotein convertase P-domain-containing protein [Chthonomonadaceae bacterium]MDW8207654.1 proprotein convertase P-domain-containing protein [Chloroherpetonaceae bacterium]
MKSWACRRFPGSGRFRLSRPVLLGSLLLLALSAYAGPRMVSLFALESSALKRGAPLSRRGVPIEMKTGYEPTPEFTGPVAGIIPDATVERDAAGHVRRVYTQVPVPGAQTPAEAARSYLQTHRDALGLSEDLSELQQVRQVESLTRHHVTYQQTYRGLPVFGGYISVHLNKQQAVELVNADLVPITVEAPLIMAVPEGQAVHTAVQAVGAPLLSPPQAEIGVLVERGRPAAVWRVTFMTSDPGADWEVMVDAARGKVISARNIARYVDGTGMVYEPEPITTSGIPTLADNNNADSPVLTAQRVSRTLRGLDGSGFLTGTYCRTAVASGVSRAFSATFNFNYTRSQNQFDETNCYYHIDTIARYIQSLGFTNVQNRQTVINVNTITDDNSFYSPSTKQITVGSGGVDDAEDAGVIWHEAGHAIQDNQVPGWGGTSEAGAMGEGFGDYWAASAFAGIGPNAPAWDVYVAKWDAVSYNPGNPPFLRRVDRNKRYPDDIVNQVHADGEIWSACLWQIRGIVGRTRADRMILESHFSVPRSGRFVDGANAILAANQALYGGQDQAAIRRVFVDRGILPVVNAPGGLTATIAGSHVQLSWTDNSDNELGFKIERQTIGGTFQLIAQTGPNVTTYLDTNVTPDTLYTYRVRAFVAEGDSQPSNTASIITPYQTYRVQGRVAGMVGLSNIAVRATGTGRYRSVYNRAPGIRIPDNNATGVTDTINIPESGTLTGIRIEVNITHTWRGDLEVAIIAPDGTTVLLHNRTGGSADDLITSYPDLTTPAQDLSVLIGKQINGTWRLRVRDLAALDVGTLNTWALTLSYNGAVDRTVTTGASGTYTLNDMPAGEYTIAPQTAGYAYTPANRTITLNTDLDNLDFTARVSVQGALQLEEAVDRAQSVTFTFRPAGGGSSFDRTVTLNSAGEFVLDDILAGEYNVRIKGAKWLAVSRSLDLRGGNAGSTTFDLLRAGDANDDNTVDVLDLGALIAAFDAGSGDPNWNAGEADFNCDGVVDVRDLDLLIRNFDASGSD